MALAGSLMGGVRLLASVLVSKLVNRVGNRAVCVAGGILTSGSIWLSTFAQDSLQFVAIFGLGGGLSMALITLPSMVVVGYYFEKRRSLANGITRCGNALGPFALIPMANLLLDTYGLQTTLLSFSGLSLVCSLFGYLLRPLEIRLDEADLTESLDRDRESPTLLSVPPGAAPGRRKSIVQVQPDAVLDFPRRFSRRMSRRVSLFPMETMDEDEGVGLRNKINIPIDMSQLMDPRSVVEESEEEEEEEVGGQNPIGMIGRGQRRGSVLVTFQDRHSPVREGQMKLPRTRRNSEIVGRLSISAPSDEITSEFQPSRRPTTSASSLLSDKAFLCLVINNFFVFVGFFVPYNFLVAFLKERGSAEEDAVAAVAVIGIAQTVGILPVSWLADWPAANPQRIAMTLWFTSSLAMGLYVNMNTCAGYMFASSLLGISFSALSLTPVIIGKEKLLMNSAQ